MDWTHIASGIVGSLIVGLILIVANRYNQKNDAIFRMHKCPDCQNCLNRMAKMESCINSAKRDITKQETALDERTREFLAELAANKINFSEMTKAIGDLARRVAEVAAIVNERTGKGGGMIQTG